METTGIVHLSELPENEVCVRLPKQMQKEMFLLASKIAGNNIRLAKVLGINKTILIDFKKSRFASTRLKIIKKISEFLVKNRHEEYSLDNLEKRILAIKTHWVGKFIYKPKFPINFNSKEGAICVSAILFDGGITANKYPFYTNQEMFLIKKVLENVKKVVGNIEFYIVKQPTGTIQLSLPKIFGLILTNGLNIPRGKKVFTNPNIPEFILNGSKEIKKAFLQQAFDDEGSPSPGKNTRGRNVEFPQSGASNQPPSRLIGVQKIISDFNIPVSGPYYVEKYVAKNGAVTHKWSIQITNQRDIRKFSEQINFSLPRKREKLKEVLNSYVLPEKFKKGENLDFAYTACHALKVSDAPITIKNVSKIINRGETHTKDVMNKLIMQNKIAVTKSKQACKGFGNGFQPKEFEVLR